MKVLIVKNAYYDAAAYTHQCARIAEELKKLGAECDVRPSDIFPAHLDGKLCVSVSGYDCCIWLDKDKYASVLLEKSGLRLFNTADAIAVCDDKMLTFIKLADRDIPMPTTIPAPLCYTASAIGTEAAERVEQILGYPLIVKTSYGSQGKGVYKIDDRDQLLMIMRELKHEPHLYQKFVSESEGRDLRVMVVGGKALGGMMRCSDLDFRSNVGTGGHGKKYKIDRNTGVLCRKIAKALGLDFCGIDLLFDKNGLTLCEVNSNAFFAEFEAVTGINVAAAIAEHVVKTTERAKAATAKEKRVKE